MYEFTFDPTNALSNGKDANGASHIVIELETPKWANDAGTGVATSLGETDCFNSLLAPDVKCYVEFGDSTAEPRPVRIHVRGISATIVPGNLAQFYIAWLLNPTNHDEIINFNMEIYDLVGTTGESLHYKEFRNVYVTQEVITGAIPVPETIVEGIPTGYIDEF